MSRPIVERPIRSIGDFYGLLPKENQKEAVALAMKAKELPKHFLESEYYRLKGIAYAERN